MSGGPGAGEQDPWVEGGSGDGLVRWGQVPESGSDAVGGGVVRGAVQRQAKKGESKLGPLRDCKPAGEAGARGEQEEGRLGQSMRGRHG